MSSFDSVVRSAADLSGEDIRAEVERMKEFAPIKREMAEAKINIEKSRASTKFAESVFSKALQDFESYIQKITQ